MEYVSSIIGVITGLAAIFTFVTGYKSLAEFRQAQRRTPAAGTAGLPRILYVYGAVFLVLIAITAAMGLSGDDIAGFTAFMLSVAAAAVIGYELALRKRLSPHRFGVLAAAVLIGVSLLTAPITRGEEGFAIAIGTVIAIGIWSIIVLQHRFEPKLAGAEGRRDADAAAEPASPSTERIVLEIAAAKRGTVRLTDIALGSELSLDQAAGLLDSLCARGHCRKAPRQSGATVYIFPDLTED